MTNLSHNGVAPGVRTCDECGVEIPRKRLDAVPGATLCIECQSRADTPIKAADRRVMNALVEHAENDEEMFAPEAHE
jgi:RNA polymerase-binding transcription factor DksA